MATPTKYTYSISAAFPTGKVAPSQLTAEILASSITTALDYIETVANDCYLVFADSLPAPSKATLDAIVAAHQATPTTTGLYAESLAEKTSLVATEALSAQTAHAGAIYEARWYCEAYNDAADGLKIGTRIAVTANGIEMGSGFVAGDRYAAVSGFARLAVKEAAAPVFAVSYEPIGGGAAFIQNVRLVVDSGSA